MKPPQTKPPAPKPPASGLALRQTLVALGMALLTLLGAWLWLNSRIPAPRTAAAPKPAPVAAPAVAPKPAPAPAPAQLAQKETVAPDRTASEPPRAPKRNPAPQAPPGSATEKPPQLTGLPTTAELDRQARLLELALASGKWQDYQDLLRKALGSALDAGPGQKIVPLFADLMADPLFRHAFLRHELLGRLGQPGLRSLASNSEGRGLLKWWLDNDAAMAEALLLFSPQDDLPKALDVLQAAWASDPAPEKPVAKKYFNLALAFAVVFDRPVKVEGGGEYNQSGIDPVSRYQWFVEHNERGQLVVSIDRSPASDLVWVVCVPVATSELDWAIRHVNLSRRGWGAAYGMVEYLMEKAVNNINPYDEYTFAEILKKGGVCADQSYFCANTARASGIPAAIIGGETNAGGHAWVALKLDPDEWNTQTGRIAGASKGVTGDPQTGREVTEQEFWLWSEREYRSRNTVLGIHSHLWLADLLADLGRKDEHATVIRHANKTGRRFPVTWQRLHDLLAAEASAAGKPSDPAVIDHWKQFVDDLRREFREHPRMTGLADATEVEHIFPHAETGWVRREMARARQRVVRDSPEQADLVATSLKAEARFLLEREPAVAQKEIARLYDAALREHGTSVTAFKQMATDYFGFARGDSEAAAKAVRDIELAYNRVLETGTKDWFRANTEGEITRMICGFYREAGDEERAEQLEKRVDRRLDRAKRGAL